MASTLVHQGQSVLLAGAAPENARAVMILLHGRGATAEDILTLSSEFEQKQVSYLAPQAAGYTWYPNRFFAPLDANEPYLSSALAVINDLVRAVGKQGIPPHKLVLGGFSQGACLALEYAARYGQRYGGVVAFSGALIGPPRMARNHATGLEQTPIFLGCSDIDFHIPKESVIESANILKNMGGEVTMRLYPGMGHTINDDELAYVRGLLGSLV